MSLLSHIYTVYDNPFDLTDPTCVTVVRSIGVGTLYFMIYRMWHDIGACVTSGK